MKYDFDTRVERRGTYCCKYDTIPEEAGENAIPAVSYTHLDVYKRQAPCGESFVRQGLYGQRYFDCLLYPSSFSPRGFHRSTTWGSWPAKMIMN